jgi:uncharacterized protein YdeI (YjbR/CyaY-like superfamily)
MVANAEVLKKIKEAPAFAQPIILHLQILVHAACPLVQVQIKWGHISFEYKGILCGIGVFKNHVSFGFWKHNLLKEQFEFLGNNESTAMGSLGRITTVKQLPAKSKLLLVIKAAVALNENGIKLPTLKRKTNSYPVVIPILLKEALTKNKNASIFFEVLSPSAKEEYIDYINTAKTKPTIDKRLAIIINNLENHKKFNWQYATKKK